MQAASGWSLASNRPSTSLYWNSIAYTLPFPRLSYDAAGLLWSLRTIKSESEISCVREACRIVAESYGHTFASAHAGMREREIYQTMLGGLSAPGGETFLAITSGSGNYDLVSKPAEDRIVQQGEMFWMDAGCRVGGYWSHYSRACVMGAPSALQMQAQEAEPRDHNGSSTTSSTGREVFADRPVLFSPSERPAFPN